MQVCLKKVKSFLFRSIIPVLSRRILNKTLLWFDLSSWKMLESTKLSATFSFTLAYSKPGTINLLLIS